MSVLPRSIPKTHRIRPTPCRRSKHYDAAVIGAGPGGLTALTHLLDQGLSKTLLVDPSFTSGRIAERYREVPSNTKSKLFKAWAVGTKSSTKAVERRLEQDEYAKKIWNKFEAELAPENGCSLNDAIELCQVVSDGLVQDARVDTRKERFRHGILKDGVWDIGQGDTTKRLVIANGSYPRKSEKAAFCASYPHLQALSLDTCLSPTKLDKANFQQDSTIAVIGNSHSAILALWNLYNIAGQRKGLKIINFYRSPLKYAEYLEGWTRFDNTGLKGDAATWAREVLDGRQYDASRLELVHLAGSDKLTEDEIYAQYLPQCKYILAATGFSPNSIPTLKYNKYMLVASNHYDHLTGRFFDRARLSHIPGLFGCGIAYPEQVTDREGRKELSVGWFKFMNYMKRVAPEWAAKP